VNARGQRGTSSRRAARSRSTTGTGGSLKPIEPDRPRALTGLVTQALAQKKAKKLEITPLSAPLAPMVSAPLTQMSAPAGAVAEPPGGMAVATSGSASSPVMTIAELRGLLTSSNRRRELVLLGELLQPPLALRPGRRLR
jgi:hypothetical protein